MRINVRDFGRYQQSDYQLHALHLLVHSFLHPLSISGLRPQAIVSPRRWHYCFCKSCIDLLVSLAGMLTALHYHDAGFRSYRRWGLLMSETNGAGEAVTARLVLYCYMFSSYSRRD